MQRRAFVILIADGVFHFVVEVPYFALNLARLGRDDTAFYPFAAGGFVDHVNRLVGHEALADIAVSQIGGVFKRFVA